MTDTDTPQPASPTARPIEDVLAEIAAEVPAEEWAKLDGDPISEAAEALKEAGAKMVGKLLARVSLLRGDSFDEAVRWREELLASTDADQIIRQYLATVQQAITTVTAPLAEEIADLKRQLSAANRAGMLEAVDIVRIELNRLAESVEDEEMR